MNVYDFDNTIYDGDSTLDFYKFCLNRHPVILLCLPKQVLAAAQYKIGKISKTSFKEVFFCFLAKLPDVDEDVIQFWNKKISKIRTWYLDQQDETDVVISASPEFLLKVACDKLDIKYLIASRVDKINGRYDGKNCYGEEKVSRFYECFPETIPDRFYTDSYSDLPMAKISQKSYLCNGGILREWDREDIL